MGEFCDRDHLLPTLGEPHVNPLGGLGRSKPGVDETGGEDVGIEQSVVAV